MAKAERISLMILAVMICAGRTQADEKPASVPEIRALITTGGHGFQRKPFFKMFSDMPGITCTNARMPGAASLLKPGLEKKYDVIVMYDMVKSILPEQRKAFLGLLKTGIGVISLHHNLGAHRDWDEFHRIIGGQYLFEPRKIDGKEYRKSTYAHGQDIDVKVIDGKHPVTSGISDFRIHDETYKHCYVSPGAHVLLGTEHPKSIRQLAWVTKYGRSPVFYLMLGHDAKAWQNPAYPKLLLNGIRWASENAAVSRSAKDGGK